MSLFLGLGVFLKDIALEFHFNVLLFCKRCVSSKHHLRTTLGTVKCHFCTALFYSHQACSSRIYISTDAALLQATTTSHLGSYDSLQTDLCGSILPCLSSMPHMVATVIILKYKSLFCIIPPVASYFFFTIF